MRITQWGEYGVLFSVYLAQKSRTEPATVGAQELAQSQGIAIDYAQQILHRLRDGGILESMRGPGGGYRLARNPAEITLFDVFMAAEGNTIEIMCEAKPLSEARCAPEATCLLRPVWYGLRDKVNAYLASYTLSDIVGGMAAFEAPIQLGKPNRATIS